MESSLYNLDYWRAREAILVAAQSDNPSALAILKKFYPQIFKSVMNQARNATRRAHGN